MQQHTILSRAGLLALPGVCTFLLMLMLVPMPLLSQDIHWSQFQYSPLNLGPSQTGNYNGDYRFAANHRRQWKSVTEPYRTFSGSFDMPVNIMPDTRQRFSAGLLFNNDKAGDSKLGTTQFALSLAALQSIDKDSIHFIGVGIQLGYVMRSIDYSALTFDEQYDGDFFNPSLGNSENFDGENHGYFDVGAGLHWMMKAAGRFSLGAGFSVAHLNKPDDSFFGEAVKVNPRMQTSIQADFGIAPKLDLVPALLLMNQGAFKELTGGTSVRFRISEKPGRNYALSVGGWIRSKDAMIASAGLDYNLLRIGVSYDFNTSDLDRASNGKGGYELSLIYIIRKVKSTGIKPPCPLY